MGDVETVWDPERLRRIGSVLERYGTHLKEGHRVRLGMEGDPCTPYRAASDAPVGTVVSVEPPTTYGGLRRFTVKLDNDASLLTLDNRSVDPQSVWEIDPDGLEAFRSSIEADAAVDEEADVFGDFAAYRGVVDSQFQELRDTMKELRTEESELRETVKQLRVEESEFRSTTASTMRHIADDLLRLSRGQSLEWMQKYAQKYDEVKEERYTGATDNRHEAVATLPSPTFRGPRNKGERQQEKSDFNLEETSNDLPLLTYGGENHNHLEFGEDPHLTP